MKKILFLLSDHAISSSAFQFLKFINAAKPQVVTGISMPALADDTGWTAISEEDRFPIPRLLDEDDTIVRTGTHEFAKLCKSEHITCTIHESTAEDVISDIQKQTRFADLLVAGFEGYYKSSGTAKVYSYIRQILEHAECPVLLVPGNSPFPKNTILSYDGSASSVYAIKMFSYLFAPYWDGKITIAYANTEKNGLPDEARIKDLVKGHFSNPEFLRVEVNGPKEFTDWLEDQQAPLFVTGSFGRSELSRFFRESFAAQVIEDHRIPVFITHK